MALATGCTATVAAAYAALGLSRGKRPGGGIPSDPLRPLSAELAVVCSALFGSCLGFLWWNAYPARVFMGDTGSLAIGGMLGGRGDLLQAGDPSRYRRRRLCHGGHVGDSSGRQLQADWQGVSSRCPRSITISN